MQLQTPVEIIPPAWRIQPTDRLAFVGSCFADNIGARFVDDNFQAVVNPYGVMYNPISVLHTVVGEPYPNDDVDALPLDCDVAVISLGTNHVYEELSSGRIVDNCRKRPQREFRERMLDVEQCVEALRKAVESLRTRNEHVKVVFTVSPIRYRKYGFHESQLSKAVLLLAIDKLITQEDIDNLYYFPSYEIVNDELRDYRFYQPDMLHPSEQAVDYIYQRFLQACFSDAAKQMVAEWRPIRQALAHKPFHPNNPEYQHFLAETKKRKREFEKKWGKKG
ncbi:MAG: GSCFA domain-containing protein [Prevotella sp.]